MAEVTLDKRRQGVRPWFAEALPVVESARSRFANRNLPPLLARTLKFVPAAMLTALVVPMVAAAPSLASGIQIDARLPAAAIATVVAYRFRSTIATLVTGMAALWGIRTLGG